MRSKTSEPSSRQRTISLSLVPSDMPESALPFGQPPVRLVEMEMVSGPIPEALHRQVKDLAENANLLRGRSPLVATDCWYEVGRILDRRAGRVAEAWTCYNRALVLYPDHKPALDALRRLARRAGERETLGSLLDVQIDKSTTRNEKAALLTERAMIDFTEGRLAPAIELLSQASQAHPEALVPQLLRLGAAMQDGDEMEIVETLSTIAGKWPEPEAAGGLQLMIALIEERLGQVDKALERLNALDAKAKPPLGALMAKARLSLRMDKPNDAAHALRELAASVEDPETKSALDRIRAAVGIIACDDTESGALHGVGFGEPVLDLSLLEAAKKGDRAASAGAAGQLCKSVRSSSWKTALALEELLGSWSLDEPIGRLPDDVDRECAAARAIVSLSDTEVCDEKLQEEWLGREGSIAKICQSVGAEQWESAAKSLAEAGRTLGDDEDRWSFAVAEAAVKLGRLQQKEEALRALKSRADRLDREPLPSFIRRFGRNPKDLANLALIDASKADSDESRGWLTAWAAHHMESVDKAEAGQLHRQALELAPSCLLAVAGIERCSEDREAVIEAFLKKAEVSDDDEERARDFIRAGLHCLIAGDRARAKSYLASAYEAEPSDRSLWQSLLRLTTSDLKTAFPKELLSPQSFEELGYAEMMALGSLGLEVDPSSALRWFERLREKHADDPLSRAGLDEARIAAGTHKSLAEDLLAELQTAKSSEEESKIYQRLADIEQRYGGDGQAAALSLLSSVERMPGHRQTLLRLAFYFAGQKLREKLSRALGDLAKVLDDKTDSIALAAAAWQIDSNDKSLLEMAVYSESPSTLDLAEMEAIEDDPVKRAKLLDRLNELIESSAIHLSKRAELMAEAGDSAGAVALYEKACSVEMSPLFGLFQLAKHLKEIGNFDELVLVLARIASESALPRHKVEALLEAAAIAENKLGDGSRASQLYLDALIANPENVQAYSSGRKIIIREMNEGLLIKLIETRLKALRRADEKLELHLELVRLHSKAGESGKAKENLKAAIALAPFDIELRLHLADLHGKDGEWDLAIESTVEAAKLAKDPASQMRIFFLLGEMYMDHSDRNDLAEKSFLKVLGIDRSHFKAMERIAELYAKLNNWDRASQALDHLVRLAMDPKTKAKKLVALADVLDTRFSRPKDAEAALKQAQKSDPLSFEAIKALADLYERQRDEMGLNFHLDRAMAFHGEAAANDPDNGEIYSNIERICMLRRDVVFASFASELSSVIGAAPFADLPSELPNVQWEINNEIGDPSNEELLCPNEVPAALRATMKAIEDSVAKSEKISADQLGLKKDQRLNQSASLSRAFAETAPLFGAEPPALFIASGRGIRIAPGSPTAVIVPKELAFAEDAAVCRFAAAMSLNMARMGLGMATLIDKERLRTILCAVVRMTLNDFSPEDIDEKALKAEAARLRQLIPFSAIDQIRPLAFDCTNALRDKEVVSRMFEAGHRAGFLAAGSLFGAIAGLRVASGRTEGRLTDLPGAGRLISFVFSKDHVELRRRLNL